MKNNTQDMLKLTRAIFAEPIKRGELILDIHTTTDKDANGNDVVLRHVDVYINTPTTYSPSRDNVYVNKLLLSRSLDNLSDAEFAKQLAAHLVWQLRGHWQEDFAEGRLSSISAKVRED